MIERFLAEVRRRVGGRIAPDRLESRLREARAHLAADAEAAGMREAVRRFGSARGFANALVRQHRGYGTRSSWDLGLLAGAGLGIAFFATHVWFDRAMNDRSFLASLWVPFFALLLFAARAFATRRWLVLPALAGCTIGLSAILVAPFLLPERATAETRAEARRYLAAWDPAAADLAAWQRGSPPLERAPVALPQPVTYYAPGIPLGVTLTTGVFYSASSVPSPDDARRLWSVYGEGYERDVAKVRAYARTWVAATERGQARVVPPLAEGAGRFLVATLSLALTLILLNGLALAAARLVDGGVRLRRAR